MKVDWVGVGLAIILLAVAGTGIGAIVLGITDKVAEPVLYIICGSISMLTGIINFILILPHLRYK